MRYPESKMSLDSAMPTSSIQAWLGQELEMRGIDAMIYTRYILSILQQDSFEFEHIESDLFPMKKDLVQVKKELPPKGKTRMKKGDRRWSVDGEEMKKTAAVECLMSVSDMTEKDEGLKNLVEETYRKLKEQQHLGETTCEVPRSVCVTPVATSASPGVAAAAVPSPPIPAAVLVPDVEESLMKEEVKTTKEGYYDAFPALLDKDGIETLPAPKEKANPTVMTVWHKKNAKLSPATSDVERTTPSELNQERPASNPQLRRSQSRGSSGESDEGQKGRKSRCKSRDHGTPSPGQDQRKPDHEIIKYGSKSAESYSKSSRGKQRSHSHSQRYRSKSQEKFSGGRNKHAPRPYVFYKLKSHRDPKGQFGKDVSQPGRHRTRQPGASFFTPRYPISPAKLGKAPKFSDSLKITDDILRLLHVRPEQEQWFDDLVCGTFPRHPIRVGHHPRRPRDDNDDDLFLYDGPIETVFPPSETHQGRLYERHSCSSVDDLVMAADVTDTVTTVDATNTQKSSRFLPFILSNDQEDDFDDFDIRLSLSMIEKDSQGSEDESTPRQDETQKLAGITDAPVPELVTAELSYSEDQCSKPDDANLDVVDSCRKLVVSSCGSDDTLKTSSSSDTESTEEDEYDFNRFTEFIENKKKGLNGVEAFSDGTTGKSRSEKLALQIDGAQSRGISLLRELQPENSDWLRGDGESSGSDNEQQCSPNLAKEIALPSFELKNDLQSGANDLTENSVTETEAGPVKSDIEIEEKPDSGEAGQIADAEEEFDDKTILDIGTGADDDVEAACADGETLGEEEVPKTETDQQKSVTQYDLPEIVEIKPDDEVARHDVADPIDHKVAVEAKKSYIDGFEEMFEKLGIFGQAIGNICDEIKKIEDVNTAADHVDKIELPSLKTEDSEPSDVSLPVQSDEEVKKVDNRRNLNNLTVDAALSNKLQGSPQDASSLSPNRSRLDGFPALLPKEEDVSASVAAEEVDPCVANNFVNIDLQAEDGLAKLQELSTFLEFSVEDIKELLPQEESSMVASEGTEAVEDEVALEPKYANSLKSNVPRYLSDNKQNESVVLSQSRATESSDDDVKMQVFTVPASSFKQMGDVFLTKDDVVVRIANNDTSDDDATDESDTESTSTATGSDGYSEILGDLDSILVGINISSDDITADMAENSAQFLEDLKLLDDSLDTSSSTDENSGSDAACHGGTWTITNEDAIASDQFPSSQTEPVHTGLQRSLSDSSDLGELPQPDHPSGVISCDNTWSISEDEIQTKQYKLLSDNQKEQINRLSLHRSQSDQNDLGLVPPPVHCSSEVMGHDTWGVLEDDTVRQSNNNFVLHPGLHRSLSDHSDILIRGDTWSVSEEDTIQAQQLNNNQGALPVIHSGLHRSSSNRSDRGLLPPVINICSDALNSEVIVQDHDKTADSGISQYSEENCEMAENIALATCGNLSSDGDSSSETSDSPCLDSPEQTPLAKHIAALTRRRHPGIGKKWPPVAVRDGQDDGYGEGQVCPEQDNAKNLLKVDNESWNSSNIGQTYLGSPRNPDLATWGSMSETTGSMPTSKDHSPWPTLDNMFSAESSDWQDRSTPSLSSSSSHSMRKVDADWQSLQLNTSENTSIGEPLYVNVNDVSMDNSSDTLYYLPSLSDSPKVEDLLAEASSMLDSMDHERFHQLLVDIENQSEGEAENMGDFSEALQKLAVNEGNYTVLQELDKLFQTYMHAEGLSDDDKLLMDAVDDLAQFSEQDPNRCMSPGGEEYSGQDDQCNKKHAALGNVGQGDPTYNLWNNSGKEISGHLNWYLGGEDSVGNLNKGHSCNDIAYWSDTELIDEKPDMVIHTSASYGQLSSLTRKRSRHHHSTAGSYLGLPHSQSANLQPSEFSAFKDKIPERMSHVRSEPHLPSRSRRVQANFKSDSDLLNKTAPVITLQKETKATIGEGYNKNKSDGSDVVISPKTHFRPIHSLTHEPGQGGYNANAATDTTGQAAIGTAIQHVEKPPLFSFSPDPNEDYQLFVTSDSESETSFVPKFKVKLDGEKWSQTDKPKKGRAVGEGKLKATGSFTDDCIGTCRKKLEQCSQEILLQCKKHVKIQLTDAILEEDLTAGQEGDVAASFEESAGDGRIVTPNEISICDYNGNIGVTCSERTEDSQESEKTDVVLSCHDPDCFCPECGLARHVAAREPCWSTGKSFYSCSGLGMDKKIVENRDGESLQGGNVELGQNINKLNVEDKQCCDVECKGIESDETADSCSDASVESGQELGCDKRKDVEYLDIMALCNTVDLMQVGDESPQDGLSVGKDEDKEKPVISTEGDSGVTSPQVPVQDVAEIWAAATDFHVFTSAAEAVTKKYSIWSVGSDMGFPSLPADVSDELILPGSFISGASNTLKEKPCSVDTTSDETKEEAFILMEDEAFTLDQPSYDNEDFDLSFIQPPHRPRAFYSSELEEVWMRTPELSDSWYSRRKRRSRSGSISNKPCSFYMEGNCRRADCRFSHDLSSITCRFWERGECFKGVTCPFMHAYNSSEKKSSTKPESLTLENKEQDFPKLSQESKSDDEKSS